MRSPSPILAPSPKTTPNSSWRSPSRRFLFPTTSPFPLDKPSFLVGSGGQYWQEMSLDLSGRLALWSYDSSSAVVNRGANHPRAVLPAACPGSPGASGVPVGPGMPCRQHCGSAGEERNAFLGRECQPLQHEGGIFKHCILLSASPRIPSPPLPFPPGAGGRRWCGCPHTQGSSSPQMCCWSQEPPDLLEECERRAILHL